jgi:hypothetical protein
MEESVEPVGDLTRASRGFSRQLFKRSGKETGLGCFEQEKVAEAEVPHQGRKITNIKFGAF